jgi:SpoVK/Ycf46/Vps4 family AAA+-type ATPase
LVNGCLDLPYGIERLDLEALSSLEAIYASAVRFWDELVLDEEDKEVLYNSVLAHTKKQRRINDGNDEDSIFHRVGEDGQQQLGQNLVILLYGPPGVGKTFTAEMVAKATGKPLIVISVTEIGLNAEQAESKLRRIFDLAARWEAILLIEDADTFLESRSSDADAQRRAFVSVLLRALEYYTGVMFLTTTQSKALDISVQSRVHLSVHYHDLSKESCRAIFGRFMDKTDASADEKRNIMQWFQWEAASANLDGRQIKNLVTSAQSIARSRDRTLDLNSIVRVCRMTVESQKQLREQKAMYLASERAE